MLARVIFGLVDFAARKGLAAEGAGVGGRRQRAQQAAPLQPEGGVLKDEAGMAPRDGGQHARRSVKERARRTGVRGETYAYWYLRRQGYVFVARNYTAPGIKGEIDLIGYDGPVLAFVEVKTRASDADEAPLGKPEDAITADKRRAVTRMARQFLMEKGLREAQCRFDVLAIESESGKRPVVRLHKAAF